MTTQDPPANDRSGEAPHAEHFEEGEETAPPGVRAMSILRWLLVAAMAAAAVLSMLYVFGDKGHAGGDGGVQYYCPMHPSVVQDHPGECPICSMTLVPREPPGTSQERAARAAQDHAGHRHEPSDPYYCPMHPEETGKDASARCPLCGMKLEKKPTTPSAQGSGMAPQPAGMPAEKSQSASMPAAPHEPAQIEGLIPVEIPENRLQLIGMRTAKVKRTSLPSELKAVGYLAPTESGLAVVQTRFAGWIEELHVTQTGQLVQRGQLLARVYSPEILSAQQELLNARQWAGAPVQKDSSAAGAGLAESSRNRLELLGMHPSEIAEVERSGTPHRLVEVRSPARGYVAQKSAIQGLYIQPGTRLFDIADLSKVWVFIELFERDAARVRAGQPASLQLTAYPGETFRGKVQLVYPTLNMETRTQRARVEFNNPALRLRPGMFGDVTIQQPAAEGLVVPREAAVETGESQYVFVVEAAGRFSPRSVQLGARWHDQVQILSGLAEGETVVTTGNFLLDSESRLRSAIEGTSQRAKSSSAPSNCDSLFDRSRFAEKYAQCRACEAQHRGMGSMEEDCRNAIPKPWR
jgi:Cu(I)/Ag(I) efflux system membrane fusion protein